MFQTFEVTARPEQGPPRLTRLRDEMRAAELDGLLVPRADAHQGEYVAAHDARLAWLTGFTGSAGFCAVLQDIAGVFIDGRYRTQVKRQVADEFTPVPWPEVKLADWLKEHLPAGGRVAYDPWLHSAGQIEELHEALAGSGVDLVEHANLIDRIWQDQPLPPMAPVKVHPLEFAGEAHEAKCARLGEALRKAGHRAAVITLPDSLCWLLNIRGADIPRNPVAHGFAVLHDNGGVDLFMAADKLADLGDHLGPEVRWHAPGDFLDLLETLEGPVRVHKDTVPQAVMTALGDKAVFGAEPCLLPKARKNAAEIAGAERGASARRVAMVELLAWLDTQPPGSLTEIAVVTPAGGLPAARQCPAGHQLRDHRRGPARTARSCITGSPRRPTAYWRTVICWCSTAAASTSTAPPTSPAPSPSARWATEERQAFTRVLQGMIAMSRLRWPKGLAGRDIEAVGRVPLWLAGQDFDHGLGHGVGAYLSVHEGPQRLSRISTVPLEPGMILSNEPGYYREGAFGIRIENLLVVEPAPALPGGDAHRDMLHWKTLTYVPIDRRLIVPDMLSADERAWLNAYHAEVAEKIGPRLGKAENLWLDAATAPL